MNPEGTPEILKSSRGGDILLHNGFLYCLNKHVNGKYYWDCRDRNKRKEEKASCHARIITEGVGDAAVVVDSSGMHLHAPDPRKVEEIKLKNALKRRAELDSGPPSRISRSVGMEFPNSVQVGVSAEAQRKLIQRVRVLQREDAGNPTDEWNVPESLHRTVDGSLFYQGNVNSEGGKALIFTAHEDLRRLDLARYWIADGTFDTVPGCFRQLFTIHASVGPEHRHTIPVVYVLMSNKGKQLYKDVLAKVSEVAAEIDIDLSPQIILTDFEKG